MNKYRNLGRGMRLFETVISKSEQNTLKMAYYGAYYSIFQDDLKKEAISNNTDPKDNMLLEAWNYPNVSRLVSHRKTRW
jgi:hypothetical protein